MRKFFFNDQCLKIVFFFMEIHGSENLSEIVWLDDSSIFYCKSQYFRAINFSLFADFELFRLFLNSQF